MKTVTEKIKALEISAGIAGDLMQAAICQIALYGEPNAETYEALNADERVNLHKNFADFNGDDDWRKLAAEQVCLDVISDSEAE